MRPLDRRTFLRDLGLATAAVWAGPRVLSNLTIAPAGAAMSVAGTTLEASVVPQSPTAAYSKLTFGPGWPTVVRTIGVEAKPGREDRRVPLASIVHLTDIHVIDAQSPARVEFLDRYSDEPGGSSIPFSSAHRPQETLTAQVSEAMIRRVNDVGAGPVTGRPFDCAVCTGDNIDNEQRNEMEWHMTLLNGGGVVPNSGGPSYEGVQDQNTLTYDPHYWHPEDERVDGDFYKDFHGFPAMPGLLSAAIGSFNAHGIKTRWFTVYGNHDGLLQGNSPENPVFESIAVGPVKVVSLPAGMTPQDFFNGLAESDPSVLAALATAPSRPVTPDPAREIVSPAEWIAAHLAESATGPGPRGHGFTDDNAAAGVLYYTFAIAPGVTGISLDSVNRGGYADGSIGTKQRDWLEARLKEEQAAGRLVIVFSHHGISTMVNPVPDPPGPGSDPERVSGAAVEALLHKYANVVAWVSGHTHVNKVTPRPDPSGATQGFWDISTAAHVDWPQQARLIEVVDNKDGTISIFATLVDHDGDPGSGSMNNPVALASIARELSYNDPQANLAALGAPEDRNVELLLAAPPAAALGGGAAAGGVGAGTGSGGGTGVRGAGGEIGRGEHPATGVDAGGALAVGAALLGGAIALRERGRRVDTHRDEA